MKTMGKAKLHMTILALMTVFGLCGCSEASGGNPGTAVVPDGDFDRSKVGVFDLEHDRVLLNSGHYMPLVGIGT